MMNILAGKFELARTSLEETLEMTPNFPKALMMLSFLDSLQGRHDEAIARMRMVRAQGLSYPNAYGELGKYLARAGREAEARRELEALHVRRQREYVPAFEFAGLYNALGEPDEAMNWLETAFEERSTAMFFHLASFEWADLRSTTRFVDLARRNGVDPDWFAPGVRRSDQADD